MAKQSTQVSNFLMEVPEKKKPKAKPKKKLPKKVPTTLGVRG
jgi:Zn-dependent oligopeptidase